ncbi:MAG: exosortase-associated EpsI family protein, partial [Deferrisomatales bacterium]
MNRRAWILAVLLLAATVYTRFLSEVQAVPLKQPLGEVALDLGEWQGTRSEMTDQIVKAVGVEDYLLRDYRDGSGFPVSVYVGYYEQQQEG